MIIKYSGKSYDWDGRNLRTPYGNCVNPESKTFKNIIEKGVYYKRNADCSGWVKVEGGK